MTIGDGDCPLPASQTLLWWREGNRKLGPRTRQAIDRGAARVAVSAGIGWEIAIKSRTGRMRADPFDRLLIVQAQMEGLTISTSDAAFDDYDVKVLDARV